MKFNFEKEVKKIEVGELSNEAQASIDSILREFRKLVPELRKELSKLKKQFDSFKVKDIKINVNLKQTTKEVIKVKQQMKKVLSQSEIEGSDKENGGSLEKKDGIFSNMKKCLPNMMQVSALTDGIRNKIKQWGVGIKDGIGNVLHYATSLFSIKNIYSTLSGLAGVWMSSQNEGARQLSANIEYMKYSMGSVFAPAIQYVTSLVFQLMKAIQSVVYAFSGVNIFAKSTANSMKGTAGSAKQASKSLSSVHSEISNVSENNSGGGVGSTNPNIDLSQMNNMPNTITEAIKNGDWYGIGNIIGRKINEGLSSIPWDIIQNGARNIASAIGQGINGFVDGLDWSLLGSTIGNGINTAFIFVNTFLTTINWGSIGKSLADFLNSGIEITDWTLIGTTIANKFNAGIDFTYNFVTKFNWKNFGTSISKGINGIIQNIDFKKLAQGISSGIIGLLDSIKALLEGIDWVSLATDVVDLLTNIDWFGILGGLLDVIRETLITLVGTLGVIVGGLIVEAIHGATDFFQEKAEECGNNLFLGFLKGIADIAIGIGQWIIDRIFQPFIDGFKNAFGIHSPSTVMAEMGSFIMQGLLEGLSNFVNNVIEIWNNIKNSVIQKVIEVKDGIGNKFQEAYNTVKNIFSNIGSFFAGVWRKYKKYILRIRNQNR